MQHMSESMFVGMCELVGTSKQVAMRRETVDIYEMIHILVNNGVIKMTSGSYKEGFRLKGADCDIMFWPNNHRVIIDMSQSEYYNKANTTLILSDISESPPGFTLLQLLTPSRVREVQSACVIMNDKVFISSSTFIQIACSARVPFFTVHGPCGSGSINGEEYDHADCFVCDFWPPSASSWIDRCHSWPGPEVVDDIVRSGCHFVAIGHPLGPHEHEEWRISFSRAEYKLVYSMNHSQFLTYGLLKLFLKEIINQQTKENNKLLCSYHIKTSVFWALQQNTLPHLCPQNFLAGFWVCFKLLLKWVYEGTCPNFFIPQNNMFVSKVHGSAQNRLFIQLHELYKKGLACLLQSSSIRTYIIDVLYNPRLTICTDEKLIAPESTTDTEMFNSIDKRFGIRCHHVCIKCLVAVQHLIASPLTEYQNIKLQKVTANMFQQMAFILKNMQTNTSGNKEIYVADKKICYILKLAAKFGFVSDLLYIAMFYYKTLRYTKVKLAQPYLMYKRRVDRERYTEAVGGQSWSTKMRQAVANDIILDTIICYISELIPEQQSALQIGYNVLSIPILAMLHFLEFLCYRHIDATLSLAALDELQHSQGRYVNRGGPIYWEILGICQQITGNL
ncbi:uncharacterized protein [Magallana gigas]|uniref:uncharacterized protein n=1 Tax=Magallana gigas TaxID=29159 RepID=UPI00333EE814